MYECGRNYLDNEWNHLYFRILRQDKQDLLDFLFFVSGWNKEFSIASGEVAYNLIWISSQIFLDKVQNIVPGSLVGMSGYHFFANASGFLYFPLLVSNVGIHCELTLVRRVNIFKCSNKPDCRELFIKYSGCLFFNLNSKMLDTPT